MPRNLLTDFEKAQIVDSYEKGYKPATIAGVLGRKSSTIRSWYSGFLKNVGLPPKEKSRKNMIDAYMGLQITKIVTNQPKIGVRRIPGLLKSELPGYDVIPSPSTVHRYLTNKGYKKFKHQLKPPMNEQTGFIQSIHE